MYSIKSHVAFPGFEYDFDSPSQFVQGKNLLWLCGFFPDGCKVNEPALKR
jgi:hypothetical protein